MYRLDYKKRDLTDIYARGKIPHPQMVLIAQGLLTPSEGEGFSRRHKGQLDPEFCGLTYLDYKVML